RPRPLSGHRRAGPPRDVRYTLIWEEPVTDTVEAAEKVAEWLHAVPWEAVASLASDLVPHIVELLIWIFLLL
ncbi:hypothetical protein QP869_11635, partial [Micrococcus luteus]|uniref:hypothetical protein n=1 Tax=Micrococcus luteus TaxID=1270 RepID=UPI00254D11C7